MTGTPFTLAGSFVPSPGFGAGGFTLAFPGGLKERYNEMEAIFGPERAKQLFYDKALKEDPLTGSVQSFIDQQLYQNSPAGRAEAAKQMLVTEKERGDQMMKYRLTNDIIANLGSIGRAAFSRVNDPNAIYRSMQDIANAGVQGAQSNSALMQQIAGSAPRARYFS